MPKPGKPSSFSSPKPPRGLPRLKPLSNPFAASRDPGPPDDAGTIESSSLYRALVEAIDRGEVLLVRFKDETEPRQICPDRIGIDVHDQYQLEAFQLSGPSESGAGTEAWKCFHLHDLVLVETASSGWHLGERASTAGTCFHQ